MINIAKVEEIHTGVTYNVTELLPADMYLICQALIIYSSRRTTNIDEFAHAQKLFNLFNV